MKRRISALMISAALLISGIASNAAFAGKKEYADQQQTRPNGEFSSINVQVLAGQTFTVGIKGRLTRVDLALQKVPGLTSDNLPQQPGDLIVEIVASHHEGPVATEEVLASTIIKQADISETGPAWYQARFDAPAVLERNRQYIIVARVAGQHDTLDGTPGSYSLYLTGDNAVDLYPGGILMFRGADQPVYNWYVYFKWQYMDAAFVTYMAHGLN